MAKQLKVPQSPKLYTTQLENFKGVDFANNETQVSNNRSPNAQNIISDLAGKPVKRTGYETLASFDGQINGIFRLATEDAEKIIVHAGTNLYEWTKSKGVFATSGSVIYSDMNNARSTAFQHDKKLFILDGKTYLVYGEFEGSYAVKKVQDVATVPMCFLAMKPDGTSGAKRHDINVLTPKRTYSFLVTSATKEFHLTADDSMKLMDDEVTVKVLDSDGKWVDKAETTDFTVDRTKGIITFKNDVPVTPSTGVDNVEITFAVEQEEDKTADLINKCSIAIQYGYNGATDRAFVSGNPSAVNFHYWSDINDPCFFPALNYAYLGQDSSAIMGYSIIGDSLVVHKEDNEQDQTTFTVRGSYDEQNGYQFAISGAIAGVGAISRYCNKRLGTEPMFLSRQGVYAITTQYLTAEKYAQNRSYYIDPKLTREIDLSEAVAAEYNGYYYLAVNGHIYVADGRQKVYEKNAPQSEYQYEWFFFTGIDVRVFWEYNGRLYFGDAEGNVKGFKTASDNASPSYLYTDDGKPIHAIWDTPHFTFGTLSRYKTLKGFWIMLSPYSRSSIEISYKVNGELKLVKEATMDIFDF
ncbi:MAG: hypothetical protein IIV02_07995, partial [Peptococcaceae bacterium]|nr:hypothetical protein [Peptococcaceae bacterium]